MTPCIHCAEAIERGTIDGRTATELMAIVRSGDLSMEEAMRLMFPEEAKRMYALDKWPYGPPRE